MPRVLSDEFSDRVVRTVQTVESQQSGVKTGPRSNPRPRIQKGDFLVCHIDSHDDCAIGYYNLTLYLHDPGLCDPTVRMSNTKIAGADDRSVLPFKGYGYNLDEMMNAEHLLDAGQYFECQVRGFYEEEGEDLALPVCRLFGNPISMGC